MSTFKDVRFCCSLYIEGLNEYNMEANFFHVRKKVIFIRKSKHFKILSNNDNKKSIKSQNYDL